MPLFGKSKAKRVCDLLVLLTVLGNFTYIIYNRNFLFKAWGDSNDETIGHRDRHRRLDFNEFRERFLVIKTTPQVTPSHLSEAKRQSGATISQFCPQEPPYLVGVLECDCEKLTLDELLNKHPDIELGGRIRPSDCRPAQRTAIIIPLRERAESLYILMSMLIPILKRQQADVTVFVIEQSSGSEFNRAALQNIGFLEAQRIIPFDCFIFHDVDLVPLSDHIMYRCGPAPRHLVANIQRADGNPKATYENYTGGVTAFTARQYRAINGNSNLYFGWGGDDDDLHDRIVHKRMTIHRSDSNLARYRMLTDEHQTIMAANPHRFQLLKSSTKRQDVEGLNTCKYKVNFVKRHQLFTWINVSLNKTEVFMTALTYVFQEFNPDLRARVER